LLLFATAAAAAEPPRTPCPGPQRCLLDGLNARHGAVAEPSAAAVMVFAAAAPPVAKYGYGMSAKALTSAVWKMTSYVAPPKKYRKEAPRFFFYPFPQYKCYKISLIDQ
jgi:hypothetical protein